MEDARADHEPESIVRRRLVWYPASVAVMAFSAAIMIALGDSLDDRHHAAAMPWRIAAAVVFALGLPTSLLPGSFLRPERAVVPFAPRTRPQFLLAGVRWAVWWFLVSVLQGDRMHAVDGLLSVVMGVVMAGTLTAVARYQAKHPAAADRRPETR